MEKDKIDSKYIKMSCIVDILKSDFELNSNLKFSDLLFDDMKQWVPL